MPDLDPISTALRTARQARGWSLDRAANLSGIPAIVIGSWERGDRNPPISKLRELLTTLGLELTVLGGQSEGVDTWVEHAVAYGDKGRIDCDNLDEATAICAHMTNARHVWRRVHATEWRS